MGVEDTVDTPQMASSAILPPVQSASIFEEASAERVIYDAPAANVQSDNRRGRPKAYTADVDERIRDLASQGISGRRIAQELHISESTVRRRLQDGRFGR